MFDFFYSDPHFFHAGVIKYENRPFRDVAHMNEELVARYNRVVGPTSNVLWLGDCTFAGHGATAALFKRLNGKRSLVRGNHDRGFGSMLRLGFDLVADELRISSYGMELRACHFPPATYYDKRHAKRGPDKHNERRPVLGRGERLIHGHTHGLKKRVGNCLNVGVEAWDYYPVPARYAVSVLEGPDAVSVPQ